MNYDTSIHMNPDANAWAKFFMQTRAENPDLVIDEALMVGWFANAMMAMHDHLQGGGPINGDHAEHILASGAAPQWEDGTEPLVAGGLVRAGKVDMVIRASGAAQKVEQQTFEDWWNQEGQFVRAGGGDYEKCFAYAAWNSQHAAQKENT